ncbi:MAG TPA: decaprenyl-phosphate phosphoribosyltransferase [Ilumatobacteraceae bacterium]
MIRALVRQARPRQWIKNVLVFAAPGAAGVLDDGSALWPTLVAFVAFCLVSSGTYYWNDLLDIEADRLHPTKRHRPLVSGAVPVGVAQVVGSLLIVGGILLGFATGHWQTVAVLAIYAALTLSYSVHLKHVAVVDLIAIASGFVLRAMAGAAAADVPMSAWFVLCTTFGSLFIVTGKRYAELRELGEEAAATRATLEAYSLTYLRSVLSVSLGATIVAYCIWAFETAELSGSDFPFYELSIVPMLIALLRYLLILEQGHGGAPEEVFAADRSLQAFGVIWLITFALGVYVG